MTWTTALRLGAALEKKLGISLAVTRCPIGNSQAFGFLLENGAGRVYGPSIFEMPTQMMATKVYQEIKACLPVESKVKAQRLHDND